MFDDFNMGPSNFTYNANDYYAVKNGRGVFAWIERSFSGMYDGGIPGINTVAEVRFKHSYDDCYNELVEIVNKFSEHKMSDFRQGASFEQIKRSHPNAEIIYIPFSNKR